MNGTPTLPQMSRGALALEHVLVLSGADRSGWICHPSQDRLAALLHVTVRQVQRYLAELVRLGRILVVRDGLRRPNIYRFVRRHLRRPHSFLRGKKARGAVSVPAAAPRQPIQVPPVSVVRAQRWDRAEVERLTLAASPGNTPADVAAAVDACCAAAA